MKSIRDFFIIKFYLKHKGKILFSVIFLSLVIFFIGSIIVNLPVIVLISVYALIISTITVHYDKKILNSLTVPFSVIYSFAFIQDIIDLNYLFAGFHIFTVIFSLFVLSRKNTSLALMLTCCTFYSLWIYSILKFVYFPFYDCVLFVCGAEKQFIVVLSAMIATSFIIQIKNNIFKRKQESIEEIVILQRTKKVIEQKKNPKYKQR